MRVSRIDELLVVGLIVAVAWNLIGNLLLPGAWYVPANLAVAALLVALAFRAGLDREHLGLQREDVPRGLEFGLVAALLVAVVIATGLLFPPSSGLFEDGTVLDDSAFERWYLPLLRIPFGTAVFEEILFRSVILGALLVRLGRHRAVLVSAGLFGLWHIVPAWEGASGSAIAVFGEVVAIVGVTTAGGVLFAWLRLASRSIIAPILAHTATNSFAYIAAVLAVEVLD